jgi:hypothetical protein
MKTNILVLGLAVFQLCGTMCTVATADAEKIVLDNAESGVPEIERSSSNAFLTWRCFMLSKTDSRELLPCNCLSTGSSHYTPDECGKNASVSSVFL